MNCCAQIMRISEYYKGRYDKAKALGIHEGSKHYKAFKEIELRYQAAELVLEVLESLKNYIEGDEFEKTTYSAMKLIIDVLTIKEQLLNDTGDLVWYQPKIVIRKDNVELLRLYNTGKDAIHKLSNLDYKSIDREYVYQTILQCSADIIFWLYAAREEIFHVGCDWDKTKEGE